MEKQNHRQGHKNRRFQYSPLELTSNDRDVIYNDKNKYKKHASHYKKKYETNSYLTNWPAQARLHPFGQRSYSTPDSTVCHYSVPLNFSFEPISLPIYSALIPPQGSCAAPLPLEVSSHSKKSKHHKSCSKNKKGKNDSINEVPAIFHTPRLNNGDQQDYTSLPPVSCDVYAPKTSDTEITCKRRFSDPGLGQISSDECSTPRSDESSESSATHEIESHDFYSLIEQVNELKESNSHLRKELHEVKLELEFLKFNSPALRSDCESLKPGTLSDAISEIRNAVKLSEEALISKATLMLEKTASECKENQNKLEERLRQEMNERLSRLEEQVRGLTQKDEVTVTVVPEVCGALTPNDITVQQQIVELEKEKLLLRKELQEAVAKRKTAEATTEKLERLVGILRKKINGVSLESSMPDEKQSLIRPLASSLEKNPFIIANNRQSGQKLDVSPFQKQKISFRAFPQDGTEILNVGVQPVENKENEDAGSGSETCGASHVSTETTTSVGPQVTMTGPVTDL